MTKNLYDVIPVLTDAGSLSHYVHAGIVPSVALLHCAGSLRRTTHVAGHSGYLAILSAWSFCSAIWSSWVGGKMTMPSCNLGHLAPLARLVYHVDQDDWSGCNLPLQVGQDDQDGWSSCTR